MQLANKFTLRIIITLAFFLVIFNLFSQNKVKIDSLTKALKKAVPDTQKIRIRCELAMQYYSFNLSVADSLARVSLDEAKKMKDEIVIGKAEIVVADIYYYQGRKPEAEKLYLAAIEKLKNKNNDKAVGIAFNSLGYLYREEGKFPEAISCYQKALKINEKIKNKKGIAGSVLQIGVVLTDQGDNTEAEKYLRKALKIYTELNETASIANTYARIGNIYNQQSDSKKALDNYTLSLDLFTKAGHKRGIGVCYNNIAGVYSAMGNKEKAIEYYEKAYKIRTEIGDKNGVAIIVNNLGSLYTDIRNLQKAKHYLDMADKLAKEINYREIVKDNYLHYSNYYFITGNFKDAYFYHKKFYYLYDSLYNEEKSKIIADINTKYETEKKEKAILVLDQQKAQQQIEITKKQSEIRKQKLFIIGILIFLLAIVAIAVLILRLYRQKKRANEIILLKNKELEQANEEILTQQDEIISQRDLVIEQKKKIEEIHTELRDSIFYAKRIQGAVLPDIEALKAKCPFECFILFKPKDIVSGDFYFLDRRKNTLIFAVADCTGHGVPGGFMSMLGFSFLQEIVSRENVISTSQVLDLLREYIIKSLHQKGVSGEQKDGMDIALCTINLDNNELQFSGANNSCLVLKQKSNDALSDNRIVEFKGDKQPIGIYERMIPFSETNYLLSSGDMVYLFSDGIEDQFGGSSGKKFYSKRIKEILMTADSVNFSGQGLCVENELNNWMNTGNAVYEQTDDITLLGIRIS